MTPSEKKLKRVLDGVRDRCAYGERLTQDPVAVVHRYDDMRDQELVALVAACVAFGNVVSIRAKLEELLVRLAPSPYRAADNEKQLPKVLRGWVHRVYRGEDIAQLLIGARKVQRRYGSLGAQFQDNFTVTGDLRESLARLCDAIREAGGLPPPGGVGGVRPTEPTRSAVPVRRGPAHLLPDVRGGSGSKRLLLFLRWMIRPADGVDLGLWSVPPRNLRIPVDTHIHKLALNLGLTRRTSLSWETAEEITGALARLNPDDPVAYDFSLCHLGMLQRCPSRRDPILCHGCGVQTVCRHWQPARPVGRAIGR